MRSLVLLLAVVGGFVAGYFVYPSLAARFQLAGRLAPVAVAPKPELHVPYIPPPVAPPKPEPEPEMEEPEPEPEVAMPEPAPPPPVAVVPPKPDETVFTAPRYPTVEEFTMNWTKLPSSTFPRQVTIAKSTPFRSEVGGSELPAGSQVFALGLENGQLTLAPSIGSKARAQLAVSDTNLKEDLTVAYNKWVERRISQAKAAFEYKQKTKDMVAEFGKSDNLATAAQGEPKSNPDGSYPVVVASLGKKVTEISLENISKWQKAELLDMDGQKYWSVVVTYTAKTPFGDFETEGQALIRDNQVEKWLYTGSKEEIP